MIIDDEWDFSPVFRADKTPKPVAAPEPLPETPEEPVEIPQQVAPGPRINYVYDDEERVVEWAEQRTGLTFRDDRHAIAREVNGEIVGAIIYDTFGPKDCVVHVVSNGSRRWMTRDFIVRAFAYPFIQCKFSRITCMVAETNEDSLHMTLGFGWVAEGRMRQAAPDGSGHRARVVSRGRARRRLLLRIGRLPCRGSCRGTARDRLRHGPALGRTGARAVRCCEGHGARGADRAEAEGRPTD